MTRIALVGLGKMGLSHLSLVRPLPGVEVRDERIIEERFFPDWTMELVRVKSRFHEAQHCLRTVLPRTLPPQVGDRLIAMTASISGDVDLLD